MPRLVFDFSAVDRILIGTVGVPGEREFFLQVKGTIGDPSNGKKAIASFALEKSQAAALAERAIEILRELGLNSNEGEVDIAPLETPIDSEFTLGVMSLTWNQSEGQFLFEGQGITTLGDEQDESGGIFQELITDDDSPDAPPILRVRVSPIELAVFARRTERVVAAGRQPCVFCGGPVNPGGHLCPRSNGYRRQM